MALLFDSIADKPQTHMLIIGVGAYPFLSGGTHEKEQTFDGALNLGQLTSPPISAEAFYNTAIALHEGNNWIKPLGSIDVLVSTNVDGRAIFDGVNTTVATMDNIRNAYWDWKERCNSNEDNVALFFFCGHGLEKAEQFLLAEDFGRRVGNPWEGSFVFDATRRGFFTCKAKTQLFFIDSCRNITRDMMQTNLPSTPIEPPVFSATNCQFDLTQKAAAVNESAYGRPNDISFYTTALIKALRGTAATLNGNSEWVVSTGTLAANMTRLLELEAPSEGYSQRCISNTSDVTDIIRLHIPPNVSMNISCDPDLALPHALLKCIGLNAAVEQSRVPMETPWNLDVAAGIYRIEANFANGNYNNASTVEFILPPMARKAIKCE
jgi:hypothetical protein